MFQSETGFFQYVVFLFLVTGATILAIDARLYKNARMRREGKYAFFLGWINLAAGVVAWAGNWAYSKFFV